MRERSELARKGIARGRSVVALAYSGGVLFVAENPSRSLQKISELYDRVGFAAAGNEAGALQHFEVLGNRRHAHLKWLGEFRDGGLAQRQPGKNRPPRRIGKCGKSGTQLVGHLN